MIKRAPIVFEPYFKTVIWGGNKICEYKGINQEEPKIGESWEICAEADHKSTVLSGEYKGQNLQQLVETFGEELLGKNVIQKYGHKFPLLIKFIDANDNLSIQVHPDDKLAMERHGCLGKTEMWYIIFAEENAKIYSGLKISMTPEEYMERVENGTFEDTVAEHESKAGDVFYLPAGRVHSIGAGNLLVEIQESSDITYRIFDYNRKDSNGKTRELHTLQAKDAIDFKVCDSYKAKATKTEDGVSNLVECEHFRTRKIEIDGEKEFPLPESTFVALICIEGKIEVACEDGSVEISAGHSALIPAVSQSVALKGKGVIISSKI